MSGASPKGVPKSKQFDDVYFSADNGLAESEYVFLDGNHLPCGWQAQERFTICETGFGTGLNFLTAWKCFEETTGAHQKLDFISFEKYPVESEEIELFLHRWVEFFDGRLHRLAQRYPPALPGFHRVVLNDRVTLTLIFDDVNEAIPRVDASVDAWFLDGFKPSTNPDMWSETVFEHMARLSYEGTRFATFTAAGAVRRGLQNAGFLVEKIKGYGRKRDMTIGVFKGEVRS